MTFCKNFYYGSALKFKEKCNEDGEIYTTNRNMHGDPTFDLKIEEDGSVQFRDLSASRL